MSEVKAPEQQHNNHRHEVEITIDTVPHELPEHDVTALELVVLAGKDPTAFYLVQIVGKKERISYKDTPDAEIKLHEHAKFITVSIGPVPVS
ncbi:MAG: multiubiquitin domain-containing protein [Solirubrobacteraceae bacterium]|jgi:hypothetical protein